VEPVDVVGTGAYSARVDHPHDVSVENEVPELLADGEAVDRHLRGADPSEHRRSLHREEVVQLVQGDQGVAGDLVPKVRLARGEVEVLGNVPHVGARDELPPVDLDVFVPAVPVPCALDNRDLERRIGDGFARPGVEDLDVERFLEVELVLEPILLHVASGRGPIGASTSGISRSWISTIACR